MAGIIPTEVMEEIRGRADIVEVISDYVTLKKAGRNYKGLCPFHQEKTPSFVVSNEKQLFHCFGCGVGGNVFTFIMKYEQTSFTEAAHTLAQRYGVQIPETRPASRDNRRERLFTINAMVLEFYMRQLHEGIEGEAARAYLGNRGIEKDVWKIYRLGYAPPRWEALATYLRGTGGNVREAEALGLIIPKKGGWYDRFRDRIIFPIFDLRDRVIGFGGRVLGDGGEPKYLNSPESFLYKKGENLYGLNSAKKHIQRGQGRIFIVEGYFDLLSMVQKGVMNVVATLGTALTLGQTRLLKRFGEEFVLLFDPDEAGTKATLRALDILLQEDIFPMVITLPDGLDPDGYFQRGLSLDALWERGVDGVEYAMEILMKGHNMGQVEGKSKAVKGILPLLIQIKDGVRRDLYFKRLADLVGVGEREIRDAAIKMRKGGRQGTKKESMIGLHVSTEKTLIQLLIQHPECIPLVVQDEVTDILESHELRTIAELVINDFQFHGDMSMNRLSPHLEERRVSEIAFSLAFQEEEMEGGMAEKIVGDCIRKIKIKALKRKLEGLQKRVKEAEAKGDEALLNSLFLSIKALSPQIRRLQQGD